MTLGNAVSKVVDKGDCEGRKGADEIYVWGALIETAVWKVIIRRQTS